MTFLTDNFDIPFALLLSFRSANISIQLAKHKIESSLCASRKRLWQHNRKQRDPALSAVYNEYNILWRIFEIFLNPDLACLGGKWLWDQNLQRSPHHGDDLNWKLKIRGCCHRRIETSNIKLMNFSSICIKLRYTGLSVLVVEVVVVPSSSSNR